ncbi:hypothetical protein Btru_069228 [Bulinus truncatus]|nr:hypothetical protein Btru_069228 [Bulinus truncatus]
MAVEVLALFVIFSVSVSFAARPTRWCVTSKDEEAKCNQLASELQKAVTANKSLESVIPADFQCVDAPDLFACMEMIDDDQADLVNLDSGLAYFAGRKHNLMPIMAEKYDTVDKRTYSRPTSLILQTWINMALGPGKKNNGDLDSKIYSR